MANDPIANKVSKVRKRSPSIKEPDKPEPEYPEIQEGKKGRKPKPKNKVRSKDVHVRLTESEYKLFNEAAEREGISLSGLLRQCTRRALGLTR